MQLLSNKKGGKGDEAEEVPCITFFFLSLIKYNEVSIKYWWVMGLLHYRSYVVS